jgi:alanyl-tRNA synthetase
MRLSGNEIRRQFIEFFAARGHTVVPSVPLVPERDPSLLFVNAGMVPFKHVLLGSETRPYTRAVNAQRCLRVSGKHNDLEDVGRDDYHHTFFEMLGNWSFGDYGKREAIAWAWELLTDRWGLPKERLWATVHTADDEAEALWRDVTDVGRARILRCEAENFWEMADSGPCGPCAEIHIDRGPDACDRRHVPGHVCAVNGGCARFLELWNLVFIQFDRGADGSLRELPVRHVDTGMGLERIAGVLQGVGGNYDCDLLRDVIGEAERLSGARYGADPAADVSLRVVADHARAGAFLVADGVLPSNEGRGYVLRRLLRRAARHGKLLGLDTPFLHTVSGVVATLMGDAYPEVVTHRAHIADVIRAEEERFAITLDRGLTLLRDEVRQARAAGGDTLPGTTAFRLYDTYGFPVDLTEDILRGESMRLDHAGFERCMEEQRERARGAQRFRDLTGGRGPGAVAGIESVRFVGDRAGEWESEVCGIAAEDGEWRATAREGDLVDLVTRETPFYAEGGGQVGDTGWIETVHGARVEVVDTRKADPNLALHRGRVVRGAVEVGERVVLRIDAPRREATRLNHSATHILHAVLRDQLGTHVRQAGSLVAPDRLRFDFSHFKPVDDATLSRIEERVNAHIRENAVVTHEEMGYDDAMRLGALAFFGDTYGDRVRVVRMGDFSIELCGGTHVQRTGDIGVFKIRSESGVAAGTRRLEAVSGRGALDWIAERERILRDVAAAVRSPEEGVRERLERLLDQQRELERRIAALQQRLAGGGVGDLLAGAREVDGVKVVAARVDDADADGLRALADRLRERLGSGVVVLGATQGDRVQLVAAVTKDLTGRVHAGDLVKRVAEAVGGGGGGRPDFAQAGGRNPAGLGGALAAAEGHVRDQLSGRRASRGAKSGASSAG